MKSFSSLLLIYLFILTYACVLTYIHMSVYITVTKKNLCQLYVLEITSICALVTCLYTLFSVLLAYLLAEPGLSCSMWDPFPSQGLNLGPLHWECGGLATGPLRKSRHTVFNKKQKILVLIQRNFLTFSSNSCASGN